MSEEIYDPLRDKWLKCTPEERVRQGFVRHLIEKLGYPASLISNEVGLMVNGARRRCDTIIWSRSLKPLVVVEYKEPGVAVNQKVFDQIARYNSTLQAPYLIVTNGKDTYCCRYAPGEEPPYRFLNEIPIYESIK